ncbi:uncharacterized protein CEXT_590941 [Caerostris extrusa]|uniref:Uncharacterized protein n=1 Tax=Caerostris extrusa TaxID=172846 RepID=A0AAV4S9Z2_CAEEX|nr:uncharacterized protein CEXT_590941 [Caerostris extrusa]
MHVRKPGSFCVYGIESRIKNKKTPRQRAKENLISCGKESSLSLDWLGSSVDVIIASVIRFRLDATVGAIAARWFGRLASLFSVEGTFYARSRPRPPSRRGWKDEDNCLPPLPPWGHLTPPAFRSLSAGTTPQHRSLQRTLTSASEGAEPLRRMVSLGSEPGSEASLSIVQENWHPVLQHTLYESIESGSQDSEG